MVTSPRPFFGKIGCLWVLLILSAAAQNDAMRAEANAETKFIVFSISGEWKQVPKGSKYDDRNLKPLVWGQDLNMDIGPLQSKDGAIVLTPKGSLDLYPFPCEKPPAGEEYCNCDQLKLNKSWKNTLVQFFERLRKNRPERYMVANSRGLEPELADAVLPWKDGQVDFGASFRDMTPGNYYVRFSPTDVDSFQGTQVAIKYAKGNPAIVQAPGLHPGLYKIWLVDEKGEFGNSDAWVLLSGQFEYAGNALEYERAVQESKKLPQETDSITIRALLRANLESLEKRGPALRP